MLSFRPVGASMNALEQAPRLPGQAKRRPTLRAAIEHVLECIRLRRAAAIIQSRRSRSALAITETELKLIAAPAIIGLRRTPKNG